MKEKILLIAGMCICFAISIAGTVAYFTAEEKAHNVITTGSIDIELQEWADTEKTIPFKDVDGIMPGMSVLKIVEVENTGKSDAYVRVKIDKGITLSHGTTGTADTELIKITFNSADWTLDNGYYYYNKILKAGETSEPVMTAVTFDTTMGNLYQGSGATVEVKAFATQVANNGTSALEADPKSWPE